MRCPEDRTFTDEVENKEVSKIEKMSVPMDSAMGLLPHSYGCESHHYRWRRIYGTQSWETEARS